MNETIGNHQGVCYALERSDGLRPNVARIMRQRCKSRLAHNHTLIPLQQYSPWQRWDTLPFIIAYSILITLDLMTPLFDKLSYDNENKSNIMNSLVMILSITRSLIPLLFPLTLLTHIIVFLMTQWNVHFAKFVAYYSGHETDYRPSSVRCAYCQTKWTHCLVIPPSSSSSGSGGKPQAPQNVSRILSWWKGKKVQENSSIQLAPLTGSIEIVPIRKVPYEKENATVGGGVCIVNYEDMIFRYCCSCFNSQERSKKLIQPGFDFEMDGIWNVFTDDTRDEKNAMMHYTQEQHYSLKHKCDTNGEIGGDCNNVTKDFEGSSMSLSTQFHRLHFPIDLPLPFYTSRWSGHSTSESIARTKKVYSDNSLPILLPPLSHLLFEQLLQPFFIFQLFCVMMWSLDEYWYYALFTLISLIVFEATMAYNRLKSLQRLRETLRAPTLIWVYRKKKWVTVLSDTLIAGDIVSMTSKDNSNNFVNQSRKSSNNGYRQDYDDGGRHIPADLLLLHGNALVNEATLTGESVPQRKEMISNVASSCQMDEITGEEDHLDMELSHFKRSMLFGGTVLMNHSCSHLAQTADESDNHETAVQSNFRIPNPPDEGCILLVLRTGFDTQQGSLLRTMVHSSTKTKIDGVNTRDTFVFILLLLLCAICSSILVVRSGWNDPTRNRFKLLLHVVIIVTSVVPPELPMELSLAVTSSLSDLIKRCAVYCTEPFRIPLGGLVTTCCLDKTGTITSDDVQFLGVQLNSQKGFMDDALVTPNLDDELQEPNRIPQDVLRVMVGCHNLSLSSVVLRLSKQPSSVLSNGIVGDPLERAVLQGCMWSLQSDDTVTPLTATVSSEVDIRSVVLRHRFAFTSKLKRMSVLATDCGLDQVWILTKGAPEVIKDLLHHSSIPSNYDEIFQSQMALGRRVLAMGFRMLGSTRLLSKYAKDRRSIECNLTFAGFLVFDSPLKPDSAKVIKELKLSGIQTKMITGDSLLTAVEVAKQVGMVDRASKVYELLEIQDSNMNESRFAFVSVTSFKDDDDKAATIIPYTPSQLHLLQDMTESKAICLCTTGDTLAKLAENILRQKSVQENDHGRCLSQTMFDHNSILLQLDSQEILMQLVPLITVFARHAPRQKEAIISCLNSSGHVTLMCGDGTNDVGALKKAAIGISIISVPEIEAKQRETVKRMDRLRKKERRENRRMGKIPGYKSNDKKSNVKHALERKSVAALYTELLEAEEELFHIGLGDASVASPFTSKTTSIKCILDIIQRGRCTLVTMNQIYKILGINCLINAFLLSILHLLGAKHGDRQVTAVGMVVAFLFLLVTKGEPLEKLSEKKPPSSVLSKTILLSVVLQFLCHSVCIIVVTIVSQYYLDPYDPSLVPDGAFNPNILNTSTFLLSTLATVNTFWINYHGYPFMKRLEDNRVFLRSLQCCYITITICTLELFPPINDLLQLSTLHSPQMEMGGQYDTLHIGSIQSVAKYFIAVIQMLGYKYFLMIMMILDSLVTYVVEYSVRNMFD